MNYQDIGSHDAHPIEKEYSNVALYKEFGIMNIEEGDGLGATNDEGVGLA